MTDEFYLFKTKQFKQLEKQWYKKLSDAGFFDIEHERMYGKMKIKSWPSDPLKYIKRVQAIDMLVNNPIFVIELSQMEYMFLDAYRFNGNIREICNQLNIKEQRGTNMIRKYQQHLDMIPQQLMWQVEDELYLGDKDDSSEKH